MVGLLRFVLRPRGHWILFTDRCIMVNQPIGANQTRARHRVRPFLHVAPAAAPDCGSVYCQAMRWYDLPIRR